MTILELRTWRGARVSIDLERMLIDFLGQALLEATAAYWRRRADELDRARPRPNDWPGGSTPQDRATRERRLAAAATACRNRAAVTLLDAPAHGAELELASIVESESMS